MAGQRSLFGHPPVSQDNFIGNILIVFSNCNFPRPFEKKQQQLGRKALRIFAAFPGQDFPQGELEWTN